MDLQNENQDFVEMEIDEMESNTTELQSQNCKEREKARWILNLRDENKLNHARKTFCQMSLFYVHS